MTIFKSKSAVCSVTLTIDDVWRYSLPEWRKLIWTLENSSGDTVLTKEYTSTDVDAGEGIIIVNLTAEETELLNPGAYYCTICVEDSVVVKPTFIEVRE